MTHAICWADRVVLRKGTWVFGASPNQPMIGSHLPHSDGPRLYAKNMPRFPPEHRQARMSIIRRTSTLHLGHLESIILFPLHNSLGTPLQL